MTYGLYNQTVYPKNADAGYAGLLINRIKADTYSNSAGTAFQSVSIDAGTAANSTAYNITTMGQTVSFTSDGTATATEIRDGLIAAIKANSIISSFFLTAVTGAGTFTMTGRHYYKNEPVTLSGGSTGYLATNTAATTAADIGFGLVVSKSTVTTDGVATCALPSTNSDVIAGITIATHTLPRKDAVTRDSLYRGAYGDNVSVLSQGEIWAIAEEACTVASTLYYRFSTGTLGVIAASSGTGKASLGGRVRAKAPSVTLASGVIIVPVEINLP